MKKTDNYGARVKIENIMEGEVDEDLLFALLTRLVVKDEVLDMDVMLASRCHEYSGHIMLAEKRLPSQSTSIQSPFQFPYDKTELRSWRDGWGVHSVGGIRGGCRGCWALLENAFTRAGFCQGVFSRGAGGSLAEA